MRLLFIAGQGRSGSTLVERVLAELPGVCALGEATHVWQDGLHQGERCGCGAWFAACEFWQAVGERAFGGWHNVDRQRVLSRWYAVGHTRIIPRLIRPSGERLTAIREFAEHHARIYTAAAAVSGASVVIDSSKYPALGFCLRWAPDLDLRVLHLVRDPRGVAYSWTKHLPRPETDGATTVPRYRPSRSALRWSVQNTAVDLLARLTDEADAPGRRRIAVRRIRYEDFLADPRGTVRSIATFLDLEPRSIDLTYLTNDSVELGQIHSASGNPMRFRTGSTPLRHDDAWRGRLPASQRRLVTTICAPVLLSYGYPLVIRSRQRQLHAEAA